MRPERAALQQTGMGEHAMNNALVPVPGGKQGVAHRRRPVRKLDMIAENARVWSEAPVGAAGG
jgi:hypothetical protein